MNVIMLPLSPKLILSEQKWIPNLTPDNKQNEFSSRQAWDSVAGTEETANIAGKVVSDRSRSPILLLAQSPQRIVEKACHINISSA